MSLSYQIGLLFGQNLPRTAAPDRGNIAGTRAVPALPLATPVIPVEGGPSL
jgi:hypothetical protein